MRSRSLGSLSPRPVLLGGVVGIGTAVGFAAVHQLIISDIWFSIVPMMVAGAACGASLVWTYTLLFPHPTGRSWLGYIALQTSLLIALGAASVALFEPVVPMAVLIAANEPPTELIAQALPLTGAFIVCAAALTSLLWGRSTHQLLSALVSSAVLVLFLGLNVSVLGLVDTVGDSSYMVAEFFALLVAILAGFGIAYFVLVGRSTFGCEGVASGPAA